MMSIDLNTTAILNINDIVYRCLISRISNSEDINLLENAIFMENFIKYFFSYINHE